MDSPNSKAQSVGASSQAWKDFRSNPLLGHMRKEADQCFSDMLILSLPPSLKSMYLTLITYFHSGFTVSSWLLFFRLFSCFLFILSLLRSSSKRWLPSLLGSLTPMAVSSCYFSVDESHTLLCGSPIPLLAECHTQVSHVAAPFDGTEASQILWRQTA